MNYYFESHVQSQLSSHSREICFRRPAIFPIPGLKYPHYSLCWRFNAYFYNNFPIINEIDDGGCPIFPLCLHSNRTLN